MPLCCENIRNGTRCCSQKCISAQKELPYFSTIPHATKPFFKQWYIHAIDASRIMTVNYAEARQVMSALRSFYGKAKPDQLP